MKELHDSLMQNEMCVVRTARVLSTWFFGFANSYLSFVIQFALLRNIYVDLFLLYLIQKQCAGKDI